MPRVNGIMQPLPNVYGTPGRPIESAKYNTQLDDLVNDANEARPITAGGTGAKDAAGARAAFDVNRARQTFYVSGGDEQGGLSETPTPRLQVDFIARSGTVLVNASCSVRAMRSDVRFAYLSLRVLDLTAGTTLIGTPEQVVTLKADAEGHFYGLSRTISVANLVVGNLHRVQLLPRGSVGNAAAPQGMVISGIN